MTDTKRLDIQGLRGLAVLLVVAFHAGLPISGGFVGVDVFFVVSGFVITRLLWSELHRTGQIRLREFYARRVRRLLPALTVVLLATAAVSTFVDTPLGQLQTTSFTGLGASLFSANAYLAYATGGYFDLAAASNPLLHMWTLAVEEQFYLFFPFAVILTWKVSARISITRRLRALVFMTVLVLLMSFALSCFFTYSTGFPLGAGSGRYAYYASPMRAWEFAVGSLLAFAEPQLIRAGTQRIAIWGGLVGIGGLLFAAFSFDQATRFPGFLAAVPALGTAVLIASGSAGRGTVHWLMTRGWLVWLGDRSYGWYLWHWPVIVYTLRFWPEAPVWFVVFASAGALVPTMLSLRFVENPIRFNQSIRGWQSVRVASIAVLLPAAVFAGLLMWARHPNEDMKQFAAQGAPHYDLRFGCAGNFPRTAATEGCTWRVPASRGTVLLLGDSNAGQFAEPAEQAARQSGHDFVLATYGGCPFAAVKATYAEGIGHDNKGCLKFVSTWSNEVLRTRPALVILGNASAQYLNSDGNLAFTNPRTGRVSTSGDGRAEAWQAGLRTTLRRWTNEGVPVLVVHAVPQFPMFDLRMCPAYKVYGDMSSCGKTATIGSVVSQKRNASVAEDRAVSDLKLAHVIELQSRICGPSVCSTNRGPNFDYRDGSHLSVPFARTLTPLFAAEIRRLARSVS